MPVIVSNTPVSHGPYTSVALTNSVNGASWALSSMVFTAPTAVSLNLPNRHQNGRRGVLAQFIIDPSDLTTWDTEVLAIKAAYNALYSTDNTMPEWDPTFRNCSNGGGRFLIYFRCDENSDFLQETIRISGLDVLEYKIKVDEFPKLLAMFQGVAEIQLQVPRILIYSNQQMALEVVPKITQLYYPS